MTLSKAEDVALMEEYLKGWAADNRAVYEWEGQVGFGRECVGITASGNYIDLNGYDEEYNLLPDVPDWNLVCPPPETPDAYHKHDCLCVLGRGPEAVEQLYHWVHKLEANNVEVKIIDRKVKPNAHPIELMLHGVTQAVLRVKT